MILHERRARIRAYNVRSHMTEVGAFQIPDLRFVTNRFVEGCRPFLLPGCLSGKRQISSTGNHLNAVAINSPLLGERSGLDFEGPFIGLET